MRRTGGTAFGLVALGLVCWLVWPVSRTPWQEELLAQNFLGWKVEVENFDREQASTDLAIIDPQGQLSPWLVWKDSGLSIALPPGRPPEVVHWRPRPLPPTIPSVSPRPLAGIRIVLDPGHYGGAYSQAEKRHFSYPGGKPVREGDLTYGTARLLAELLTSEGARVHISRGPPPSAAPPAGQNVGYYAPREARLWLREHLADPDIQPWVRWYPTRFAALRLERLKSHQQRTAPFELYNAFDLRRRARVASDGSAHLTLSLHYNMAKTPHVNKLVFFVPGNFLAGELDTWTEQFYAIRRVLEGQLSNMIALAKTISRAMHEEMDMPPPPTWRPPSHGRSPLWPVDPEASVFARNLAMLKRTPGWVLLLEGPCMNNPEEYERLQNQDLVIDGRPYPVRIRSYARAVHRALLEEAPRLQAYRASLLP